MAPERKEIVQAVVKAIGWYNILKIVVPCVVFVITTTLAVNRVVWAAKQEIKTVNTGFMQIGDMYERMPLIESDIATLRTTIDQHRDSMSDYEMYKKYYFKYNKY